MKTKKLFKQIIVLLLVFTMLSGQVMTGVALAADLDGIPVITETNIADFDDNNQTGDIIIDEPVIVPEEITGNDEGNIIISDVVIVGDGFELDADAPDEIQDGNGGISIKIASSQTVVKDGQEYTFTVAVRDENLNQLPNIVEGSELVVKLPPFLTRDSFDYLLTDTSYFKDVRYDKASNTITLVFKEPGGTWVNFQFNITTTVDTIGYDGDSDGEIEVGLGGMDSGVASGSLGVGIGTGESTPSEEPYLRKYVWSNTKDSKFNMDTYDVVRDENKPIGYSVAVGINEDYTHRVVVSDNLSNGNLTLCDANGNTNAPIESCVRVVGDTSKLGSMSIVRGESSGFSVVFSREEGFGSTGNELIDLEIRYFALITGDKNSISNAASLTIDDNISFTDSNTVVRREDQGQFVSKYAMVNGQPVKLVNLDDAATELTFRINISQIGNSMDDPDGTKVVFDLLEDCFIFNPGKVSSNCEEYFRIEQSGQMLEIVKNGSGIIPQGNYYIDFTVTVDTSKLKNGEQATNVVGDTVIIRRPAKITINKAWLGEKIEKGSGAKFGLYTQGGQLITETAMSTGNSFTLVFWADDVAAGENNYVIKESVDPESGYMAAEPINVRIAKDASTNVVTIVSINGESKGTGAVSVDVDNTPDRKVGTLTFRKYGGSVNSANLLDGGGVYELYNADGDKLVERFSTINGEKRFTDLPYGVYYVKEITAPAGYVLRAEASANVELKKVDPHKEINFVNNKYTDGSVTIKKVDGNGTALSGIVFTLTYADGKTVTKTTDGNGSASFTGLEAGVYAITETVPVGYTGYTGAVLVTIDEKGSAKTIAIPADSAVNVSGNAITINWTNTQLFGGINIVKHGETASVRLQGAEFVLINSANEEVRRDTTKPDGSLSFTGLPFGKYILKEVTAPAGYVISSELSKGVEVNINSTTAVNLSFSNAEQTGSITIEKKDKESGANLSGAKFGLYTSADSDTPVSIIPTDTNGKCTFTDLKSGTYYVREVAAPVGYSLSDEVLTFNVGVVGDQTQYVWTHSAVFYDSKKLYDLRLVKTDENGTAKLAGAEFTLSGNDINLTAVSSAENGEVIFKNIPYGTYTVTETKAPAGYVAAAAFTVTVSDNNTPAYYTPGQTVDFGEVKNTHTRLTVLKVDDKNESKGLPGTTFVIMSRDDNKYVTASGSNGAYTYTGLAAAGTEFITGADGTFALEYIPVGNYVLIEIQAPEGYIIAKENSNFTITRPSESVTVGNTQVRASMTLTKLDDRGKLLANIGFTIDTASGYVQASGTPGNYTYIGIGEEPYVMYTNAAGVLNVSGLLWGDYTIDEVDATTPAGLIPVHGIKFAVRDEHHNQTINLTAVDNRELGDITLTKVDTNGEALAGAVFKAVCITTTDYTDREVRYAVSDENGTVVFKDVPYGVYEVSEFLAPYGKELSTEVYYFSVGNAEAPEGITLSTLPVTCINDDIEIKTTFKKVNTDGEPIVGMVFDVTDTEGKLFYEDVSVNELTGTELALPAGEYYLVEKQAPANYIPLTEPVFFKVTVGGVNVVVVENKPFIGEFSVTKFGEDGEKLAGAEFAVYNTVDYYTNGADAKVIYTLVTDRNGTAAVKNVHFGDYTIVETKAPDGYELNTAPQSFTISAEEGKTSAAISFTDEKSRYVFEVYKADINDKDTFIPNTEFVVYGNGVYITVVTGEDGKAVVEVPAPGIYNIVETRAPEGYTIDPNVYQVEVTGHTPKDALQIEASFTSEDYPTQLNIIKVDENDELLDGAVFEIYDISGGGKNLVRLSGGDGVYVYDASGAVTQISAGSAVVKKLPVGTYLIHEVSAPANYMPLGDITVTVTGNEYSTPIVVTAANMPYERAVAVCKENADGIRLKGAEFTLYDADGKAIETVTTGASGYAVFKELPGGSYSIKETAAPAGYKLSDTVYSFTIDENGILNNKDFVNFGSEELPFYIVTVVDDPVTYSFEIIKVSAMNGEKLDGAKFRIFGNGINMTVTAENGIAKVNDLPVGEYMLTEIKAPNGYIAAAESHFVQVTPEGVFIDSEKLTGERLEYTVPNEPESFELAIEKLDEDSRKPLEGAAFTITGKDGSKYYLVTDANGRTDTVTLKPGEYAITESVAPKGYNVPLAGWSFIVEEGTLRVVKTGGQADYDFVNGVITVTITNKRTTGSLLIHKVDAADSSKDLSGAQFMVFDANGANVWFTLKNGVFHATSADTANAGNVLTTNGLGQALLDGLEFGNYTVTEVTAPYGYKLESEGLLVKLTDQDETLVLNIKNEELKRTVSVIKQSAETHEALLGAVFALYTVKDGKPDAFVAEGTTLYDGRALFEVPYGDYVIVETKAPLGYELSEQEPVFFSYNENTPEDEAFVFVFENEKTHYAIEAYKFDEASEAPLPGAVFAFTDSRGYTKFIETDENGIALFDDIAYDDYTVREVIAPEGYYLNEEVFTVSKAELAHKAVVRVDVPDELILGSVSLKKVDYEDETRLLDAEFIVTNSRGKELLWTKVEGGYVLSDEGNSIIQAGDIVLSEIPAGDYTITEVRAPDGYLILAESYDFSITAENAVPGIEIVVKNLVRKIAFGIMKVDIDDTSKRLENAEFTLYDENGKVVAAVTTDKNGIAVFTDLTMGSYTLRETAAPYGYRLFESDIKVTVDADGNVSSGPIDLPNVDSVFMLGVADKCILQDFTIKKVDSDNGAALPGAVFKISAADRSWNVITDDKGEAKLSLPYGEYMIEEIIAPEGYVLSDAKYLLNVSEDGIKVNGKLNKEAVIEIENDAIVFPFSIHKQDAYTGRALVGAEFTISGENDFEVVLRTNAAGNTDAVYLRHGEYTIAETKAPHGYDLPLTGWKLTVNKNGTMDVEGDLAVLAVYARSYVVTIDNKPPCPPPPFSKTGESGSRNLLLAGASMSLCSFCGLTVIAVDEKKRRREDET